MKRSHRWILFCLIALFAMSVITEAQSKRGKRAAASATKEVTVTLVRWPYT